MLCHPTKGLAPLPLPPQAQFCSGLCEPDGLVTSDSHPWLGSWQSCPRLPVSNQCPQSLHKLSNAWSRQASKPPHAHQPWGHHSRPDAAQTRMDAPSPPVGSASPQDAQALPPLWHCRGQISTNTPSSLLFLACALFPLDNTMLGAAPPRAALGFWSPFSALAPEPRRRCQGQSTHRKGGGCCSKSHQKRVPWEQRPGQERQKPHPGHQAPRELDSGGPGRGRSKEDVGTPRRTWALRGPPAAHKERDGAGSRQQGPH